VVCGEKADAPTGGRGIRDLTCSEIPFPSGECLLPLMQLMLLIVRSASSFYSESEKEVNYSW
jgi:hypothetical protein